MKVMFRVPEVNNKDKFESRRNKFFSPELLQTIP